jgi:hypothetical protein
MSPAGAMVYGQLEQFTAFMMRMLPTNSILPNKSHPFSIVCQMTLHLKNVFWEIPLGRRT